MQDWMIREMIANKGLNYFDMGDYERAIKYYSELLKNRPDDEELYFWRARAYREAALAVMRQNDHNNTEQSLDYFKKSNDDYERVSDLIGQ